MILLLLTFLLLRFNSTFKSRLGAIEVIVAVSFFFGGLPTPQKLFKILGNCIFYVKIMAIGLSLVLLALVVNKLACSTET